LDASLSMAGHGGRWREALDTARALARAGGGGVIWRFGSQVRAYDSLPPGDGATRLVPALAAAAGREGPVAVVTDGAISDVADLPSDLLARAHVIVLPRPAFFDAFISDIVGPRRVGAGDTVRLRVSYGTTGRTAGRTAGEGGTGKGTLVVSLGNRRLMSRVVSLPDSGTVSTDITLPPSPFTGSLGAGWQALGRRHRLARRGRPDTGLRRRRGARRGGRPPGGPGGRSDAARSVPRSRQERGADVAHAGRPGGRLVRAAARAVSARRGVGRRRVGF